MVFLTLLLESLPGNADNKRNKNRNNEVPLCACCKASITVEAAVVIPLVTGLLVTLLFWFRVLEVETEVYEALTYASRQTAAVGNLSEQEGAELVLAEAFFQTKLSKAKNAGKYLSALQNLVILADSTTNGDYVDLVADYRISLPITFFTVRDIHIRQESKSRKWIGSTSDDAEDAYVYITESGTVYHLTKSCRYLDLTIRTENVSELQTARNKSGHKYYECERCASKNTGQSMIYITDYGDSYHYSLECSGLKRSVSVVPISETGDMRVCSKCAKNAK
jgi:hypothetical protein